MPWTHRLNQNRALLWAAAALIFLTANSVDASEANPLPSRQNPVTDLAGIIDPTAENKINAWLTELEQKTTAHLTVLTIPGLEGRPIEELSLSAAREKWPNGQGKRGKNLLLLVAVADRAFRFEAGYELANILPGERINMIGREYLIPHFRKGDYSGGIYSAAYQLTTIIAEDAGVHISAVDGATTENRPMMPARTWSGMLIWTVAGIVAAASIVLGIIWLTRNDTHNQPRRPTREKESWAAYHGRQFGGGAGRFGGGMSRNW